MLTQITSLLSLAPKAETASTPTPTRGGTDFSEIFNQLAGQTPDKDAEPKAVDPELELAEGVPHPDNTDEDPSNPGKLSVGADMGNAFEDEAEFDLPFLRRQTAEDDTMPAAWFRSARNAASSGPIMSHPADKVPSQPAFTPSPSGGSDQSANPPSLDNNPTVWRDETINGSLRTDESRDEGAPFKDLKDAVGLSESKQVETHQSVTLPVTQWPEAKGAMPVDSAPVAGSAVIKKQEPTLPLSTDVPTARRAIGTAFHAPASPIAAPRRAPASAGVTRGADAALPIETQPLVHQASSEVRELGIIPAELRKIPNSVFSVPEKLVKSAPAGTSNLGADGPIKAATVLDVLETAQAQTVGNTLVKDQVKTGEALGLGMDPKPLAKALPSVWADRQVAGQSVEESPVQSPDSVARKVLVDLNGPVDQKDRTLAQGVATLKGHDTPKGNALPDQSIAQQIAPSREVTGQNRLDGPRFTRLNVLPDSPARRTNPHMLVARVDVADHPVATRPEVPVQASSAAGVSMPSAKAAVDTGASIPRGDLALPVTEAALSDIPVAGDETAVLTAPIPATKPGATVQPDFMIRPGFRPGNPPSAAPEPPMAEPFLTRPNSLGPARYTPEAAKPSVERQTFATVTVQGFGSERAKIGEAIQDRISRKDGAAEATRTGPIGSAKPGIASVASQPQVRLAMAQVTNPSLMEPSKPQTEADDFDPFAMASFEEGRLHSISGTTTVPGAQHAKDTTAMILRQISENLPRLSDGKIDIRLSPEELGKVRMQLTAAEHGMTVHIQAERPETLDLLRRNIDQLAQDLADAGFEATGFTFGDQRAQGNDGQGDEGASSGGNSGLKIASPDAAPTEEIMSKTVPLGGMDIRI